MPISFDSSRASYLTKVTTAGKKVPKPLKVEALMPFAYNLAGGI